MTLAIQHNEKMSVDKELYHKLDTRITVLIILSGCLGVAVATLVAVAYGSATLMSPFSSTEATISPLTTDLGNLGGFVISSDNLPVDGASIVAYKSMGLTNSADKNPGYSTSIATASDGSFELSNLPSGVYKITLSEPNGDIQAIDNYAVWPGSGSSYVFVTD
jgi:hypothetical protein